MEYYCNKTGREFRVVPANKATGGIDPDEVMKYVDKDTCLLSIMAASNIFGNIMDIKEITRRAKEINPDIYVISDAVQHAPHAVIDVEDWGVDVANFAPYKFFGIRGCGYAYVSDRVAKLPHHKLIHKEADVWNLGTPAPANYAAMMAVIDYVCDIGAHFLEDADKADKRALYVEGMNRIHLQERALLYRMLEGTDEVPGLRHIDNVEVYVDMEDLTYKDLIVAMGIRNQSTSMPYRNISIAGVYRIRALKQHVLQENRRSPRDQSSLRSAYPALHYNSTEDIDEFTENHQKIAEAYSFSSQKFP
ncbi:MAG: aminotransferase class V-fold PLP-dependent enzyme [[Clostridium] scindens]